MGIEGSVVLITGASEGIGLAAARLFAANGAKVALAARSAEKLEQLASELPDALAIPIDLRHSSAIPHMVAQAQEHFGRIDALINNAGQGLHIPIAQVDLQQFRDVFELNVIAVVAAMQAVLPPMRTNGGGVIVNISSGTSKMILPGVGPYSSTKYALNAITLVAREELAPENIRVCLVYPSMTATSFHDHLANGGAWGGPRGQARRLNIDSPEQVAENILEAVQTEAAEVYVESLKARLGHS